jgi:hypothetical protein
LHEALLCKHGGVLTSKRIRNIFSEHMQISARDTCTSLHSDLLKASMCGSCMFLSAGMVVFADLLNAASKLKLCLFV